MNEEEKMLRNNTLLLVANSMWAGVLVGVVAFDVRADWYLMIAVSLLLLVLVVLARIQLLMYRKK